MTPDQIATAAVAIAGDRAVSTSKSNMNMTITCADAATASTLRGELAAAKLQSTPHRNNANIVVVLLRPRQQIIIRRRTPNFHIGRFYGDRGER